MMLKVIVKQLYEVAQENNNNKKVLNLVCSFCSVHYTLHHIKIANGAVMGILRHICDCEWSHDTYSKQARIQRKTY